jgi:hypothetical protein
MSEQSELQRGVAALAHAAQQVERELLFQKFARDQHAIVAITI